MQLRALGLVVFVATQAVAGGVTGAVHLCRATPKQHACRCQHAKQQTDDTTAVRRLDCCETRAVEAKSVTAAAADFRTQASHVAAPPAQPVAFLALAAPAPRAPAAWTVSPPSQGPPLFLKLRSLLN
jgi:hypothetical protein